MRENVTVRALRMTSMPVFLILLVVLLLIVYCVNSGLLTVPVQADVGAIRSGDAPRMAVDSVSAVQPLLDVRYDAIEHSSPY
jgi:hypothetical protein